MDLGEKGTVGAVEGLEPCFLRLPQHIISTGRQNLEFEKSMTGQLSRAPVGKEAGDPEGTAWSEISGSLWEKQLSCLECI